MGTTYTDDAKKRHKEENYTILHEQFYRLKHRSESCKDEQLSEITLAMLEIYKTLYAEE